MSQKAKEILDTMLGYLGFVSEIKEIRNPGGVTLMVYNGEADKLIGPRGETLEDIQFLLNRLLQEHDRKSDRVQVDVEHHRQMREDGMLSKVQELAELVRKTGRPFQLEPMNSYDRRIVHNAFKDDPEITTWSPSDDARIKRITLKKRSPYPEDGGAEGAENRVDK